MSHDDEPKTSTTTRPPPADAEDLYDVNTAVGEASADILAIVRAGEDAKISTIPQAPAVPKMDTDGDRPSDAPTRVGPLPTDVAITAPPPPMPSVEKVERALAGRAESPAARPGLPPAAAIGLLFLAVTVALAAIVR